MRTVVAEELLFSLFVGVFFGIYPANTAAKLNPINAPRAEYYDLVFGRCFL